MDVLTDLCNEMYLSGEVVARFLEQLRNHAHRLRQVLFDHAAPRRVVVRANARLVHPRNHGGAT